MIQELDDIFDDCMKKGIIQPRTDIDYHLIKSLFTSAQEDLKTIKKIEAIKTDNYSFIFTVKYNVLRKLIDAILLHDKLKCSNHQCINAYLCKKHPDYGFDWDILETLRLLRNRINYTGLTLDRTIWNMQKFKIDVCIKNANKVLVQFTL